MSKDLEIKIKAGKKSEMVLKEIKDVINEMRQSQQEGIATSKYKDVDGREECYRMLRVIDSFENHIIKRIKDGKAAETALSKAGKAIK